MSTLSEQIQDINTNFNDLGTDLVLLEALLQAIQGEHDFPEEYVESGLKWMEDAVLQHTGDLHNLTHSSVKQALTAI